MVESARIVLLIPYLMMPISALPGCGIARSFEELLGIYGSGMIVD
jgi:hypothetical protein